MRHLSPVAGWPAFCGLGDCRPAGSALRQRASGAPAPATHWRCAPPPGLQVQGGGGRGAPALQLRRAQLHRLPQLSACQAAVWRWAAVFWSGGSREPALPASHRHLLGQRSWGSAPGAAPGGCGCRTGLDQTHLPAPGLAALYSLHLFLLGSQLVLARVRGGDCLPRGQSNFRRRLPPLPPSSCPAQFWGGGVPAGPHELRQPFLTSSYGSVTLTPTHPF